MPRVDQRPVTVYTHCQKAGCTKKIVSGKKYCSRDCAPYGNLLDPNEKRGAYIHQMKTKSAKAKGRRLAEHTKELILKYFTNIQADDIMVTPSGMKGPDLQFSPHAEDNFPFAVECKNQESINIWDSIIQAKKHAANKPDLTEVRPMLIFARNRQEPWVAVNLEDFMKIFHKAFFKLKEKPPSLP